MESLTTDKNSYAVGDTIYWAASGLIVGELYTVRIGLPSATAPPYSIVADSWTATITSQTGLIPVISTMQGVAPLTLAITIDQSPIETLKLNITANPAPMPTPPSPLSAQLLTIISRIRVLVKPAGETPYMVNLLVDPQTILFETESSTTSDWFGSSCIIGMEDRGLPYDGLGHGECTFRIWWAKSPNTENYGGYWWAVEVWFGGAYSKSCEIFEPLKNTWTDVLDYAPGAAVWAVYKEVHPDGHIMNP